MLLTVDEKVVHHELWWIRYEDVATAAKRWNPQNCYPWPCGPPKGLDVPQLFALGSRQLAHHRLAAVATTSH